MTSQKLYEILKFVDALDERLHLQTHLESVKRALVNLVNQPAAPQHQSALASALGELEKAAADLRGSMSPSQYAAIEGMGGAEYFDPSIADKVKTSVQMNAMTPSVARDFVQDLAERREHFLSTVRSVRKNLEELGVTASKLEPGSADLAFLIPRNIFDNQLAPFAKELSFISRLLLHFSEALTGTAEPVELEQLSSSIPTVALAASIPVIGAIAVVVNKFLEAWEKIEKIRKIRSELREMGLKGAAVDELTEQIATTVDEVVEESTQVVLVKYEGSIERRNELANAIRQDTRRLFGQIERGLTVEFRTEPSKDDDVGEQKALEEISDLGSVMRFPPVVRDPVLLASGEILEGEIQAVKQTKKTTTHKTTASKKGVQKDGGSAEPKE